MTMRLPSLFLKIFSWFWATVIATGIALVITWILLQPKNLPSQSQTNLAATTWASGTAAVNELEQQGNSAASAYMEQFNRKTNLAQDLDRLLLGRRRNFGRRGRHWGSMIRHASAQPHAIGLARGPAGDAEQVVDHHVAIFRETNADD